MKKVVVTGLGAITPLGNDVNTFWSGLVNGHSGAGPITKFDASKFKTRFACEVRGFDPSGQLDRNEMKRTDLFTQYALVAASQAIRDAGLDFSAMDPFDTGVIWGTGQGGMQTFEDQVTEYALSGAPAPGSGGAAAPDGPGSGPQPRFSP
ncbi:MAG: beta-ketoacyl synthase N-terminal-like domain-containing protein, partial [Bacteroidota bacterium]|nr:beta-ketoacyl synthase N-terminal-like domain-containing protein [Bacteroidota bacterium]